MSRSAKVAVSMDPDLLTATDRCAELRGVTRSALVGEALRSFLRREHHEQSVRRYVEALRESPEAESDVAVVDRLGVEALRSVSWDDV